MGFAPLVLDLKGVRFVVVGAGRVAGRKIAPLRRAAARVSVIAPCATPLIRRLARLGRLQWRQGPYRAADLKGARFAVAAASDPRVNRAVARDARRLGIFVDLTDDPRRSTFHLPAVLARGPLLVAVSTSGESPAFARALRDRMARRIAPETGAYVRIIGRVRRRLLAEVPDTVERDRRYRRLLRAPLLRLLRSGRLAEARAAARRAAGLP